MTTFDWVLDAELRFREIADAAPVIVIYSGQDGSALFVNRAWLEFCGTTLQQSLGDGWIEACHPDDRELVGEAYWKAFQEHVPFSVEFRMRRRDGVYRWMLGQGSPRFREDGSFAGFIGCLTDITANREVEAELDRQVRTSQAIAATCGAGYLLLDRAGRIVQQGAGCIYSSAQQFSPSVSQAVNRAATRRETVSVEDSGVAWTVAPIFAVTGEVAAVAAIFRETAPPA